GPGRLGDCSSVPGGLARERGDDRDRRRQAETEGEEEIEREEDAPGDPDFRRALGGHGRAKLARQRATGNGQRQSAGDLKLPVASCPLPVARLLLLFVLTALARP